MLPDFKRCPTCGETKRAAEFGVRSTGRYLRGQCKTCCARYSRRWKDANPEKYVAGQRRKDLRIRYSITPEQYDRLLAVQGGACAICGTTDTGRRKHFDVDHAHKTGAVRGLLCSACNKALGGFGDNPILLRLAADYLTNFAYDHLGHDVDGGHAA